MALIVCSSCHRHHRASDLACPFCAEPTSEPASEPAPRGSTSGVVGLAAAVGLSLAGCGPKATKAPPAAPSDPITQPAPGDGTPTDPPPPDDVTPQPPDDREPPVQPLYGVDMD